MKMPGSSLGEERMILEINCHLMACITSNVSILFSKPFIFVENHEDDSKSKPEILTEYLK